MEPWVTEHSRQPVLSVALAPDYGAADRGLGFGATIRINKKAWLPLWVGDERRKIGGSFGVSWPMARFLLLGPP